MACWGRITHVGGPADVRLQGYQVSSVLCPRGVTVMDAQKRLDFKSGRPAGCMKIPACSRARARARRGRGDQIQIAAVFKLLLQNGRVKHRDLLRVFGVDVMQQAAK